MDKNNKTDVEDDVQMHKGGSDVDVSGPAKPVRRKPQVATGSNVGSTTSSKHEGPFSNDPFAANY
ncbi:MAG: hypothetical protein M1830_000037 [Pleopsidium flavum]|nr:MAG: hypothetical protein M1830_000037 [Pleopsidium flavum]